ncbi:MAG TPA: flagellar hook assembly protein FlgD [Steroidobacteraceae bacterium]|jgi:flagellar basal-body rod modification protein FlgD
MSVADIINGTSAAGSAARAEDSRPKDQLGQAEFLELMIAQLKNQDPFKAMDPSQFLGQLAQFGTVSGIQEVQGAISSLSESMRSAQVLEGATMVGRSVLVAADEIALAEEGSVAGAVDVPEGATNVQITVRDAAGQIVRRIALPDGSAGLKDFTWDGLTDEGTRAAAGEYTFEAVGTVAGASSSLETLLSSRVSSVIIDPARGLTLNTHDLGAQRLSDVRRVM